MSRAKRLFGATLVTAAALLAGWWALPGESQAMPRVTVYKSATCGCCTRWIEHLEQNGFTVQAHNVDDLPAIKQQHGVSAELASCHTAVVDGYVIEGHVPASDIERLLAERPALKGLAVPGMPVGSPGMEQGPYKDRYTVVGFSGNQYSLYARH